MTESIKYYQKACNELDNARSCSNLGFMYFNGNGVSPDKDKAFELLSKACDLNDTLGCYNIGAILLKSGDYANANGYIGKACDLGHDQACYALGVNYERGRGVTPDMDIAASFYQRACLLGLYDACF